MFGKKKHLKGSDDTDQKGFPSGSNKGWIHPDSQLAPSAGVCYGVRYIGCLEVKVSMRTLDFETRTAVARESIHRVCHSAGLTTGSRRKKSDKKIAKQLGEFPFMKHAGSDVNLTITTEHVLIVHMDSGETIADHLLPTISFASGGDPDTVDFLSYVAKDPLMGRSCHVLECGGGLAQDVIQTIGQAFELRYNQHLNEKPEAFQVPDADDGGGFRTKSLWDDDEPTYVNDSAADENAFYNVPKSNAPLAQSTPEPVMPLGAVGGAVGGPHLGTAGSAFSPPARPADEAVPANSPSELGAVGGSPPRLSDSKPTYTNVPATNNTPEQAVTDSLIDLQTTDPRSPSDPDERWFHGPLTRKQAEQRLQLDGDFLVRKSTTSSHQYVLSGIQGGVCRHLLLVDPNGVVRTKDRTFDSVSHLINFHHENTLPIISQDSELLLQTPVASTY